MAHVRNDPGVEIVNMRLHPVADAYHLLLGARWWWTIAFIAAAFLIANVVFALLYWWTDGIGGAYHGTFTDAFFFSVQTIGTMGYGAMYPQSTACNAIVVAEAVTSLVLTAVATGLVFAKFQQSPARIIFSDNLVIAPYDGVPTLMFRVANERSSYVVEAQLRLALVRDEKTQEGRVIYRVHDLKLARDRQPAFTRTWLVMHTIDASSPLYGMTPEMLAETDTQIFAGLVGNDEISSQLIHARRIWRHWEIKYDHYLVDMLEELPDGNLRLHYDKFHLIEPVKKEAA